MYKITKDEIQEKIEMNDSLYSLKKYGIKRAVYNFNNTDISVFFPKEISLNTLIAEYHCRKSKQIIEITNLLDESKINYEVIFDFNNIDDYIFLRYKSFLVGKYDLQHLLGIIAKGKVYYNLINQNISIEGELKTFKNIQKKLRKTKKGTIRYLYDNYLKKIETYNAIISIIRNYLFDNFNPNLFSDMHENNEKIIRECLELDEKTNLKNTSELTLFMLVKRTYPDAIYQHRPNWLSKQSLDIFIPSLNIAIEYNGQQHYEAIDFFGGLSALKKQQERDFRKKQLCKENNIYLIEWKYDEIFSDELLNKKILNILSTKDK